MIHWEEEKIMDEEGTLVTWSVLDDDRYVIKYKKYLFRTSPYYVIATRPSIYSETEVIASCESLSAAKRYVEKKIS